MKDGDYMPNGTKFLVHKNSNYTCINNTVFKEQKMTWAAKGLLCCMLSLPENWDYSIRGLCALSMESRATVQRLLNELQTFGYVKIKKLYPNETNTGRISYEYHIYETPNK